MNIDKDLVHLYEEISQQNIPAYEFAKKLLQKIAQKHEGREYLLTIMHRWEGVESGVRDILRDMDEDIQKMAPNGITYYQSFRQFLKDMLSDEKWMNKNILTHQTKFKQR
jgi:hypothetical protein